MASFTRFGALAALSAAMFTGCASTTPATSLNAKSVTVNAVSAQGIGQNTGQIQLLDSPAGLVIQTNLTQLPPGPHGFHIHEKGSCAPGRERWKMGAALCCRWPFQPEICA